MNRRTQAVPSRRGALAAMVAAVSLSACISEQPTAPRSPLLPPTPPDNPEIVSAAWRMDVDRTTRNVVITPPAKGLDKIDAQLLADYFGVAPGSPDLSILAGDVIAIEHDPASFTSTINPGGGTINTHFQVRVRNKLSAVNIITPTFPAPPSGTSGVILFPFEIVVTETPGGVTVGGDGTDVLIELPNRGLVAPSTQWDVEPHNFFNDATCGLASTDCYRSETFLAQDGASPVISGGARSQFRQIGFDHDATVSRFRVRMILAGDLEDATPNDPPVANAGGPYSGFIGGAPVVVTGAASTDPDGTIELYAWDLDNDGAFDDGTGVTANFTCTAPAGEKTIRLQVTDNRSATAIATATVDCSAPANIPPIANIGGPYIGVIGGAPVALSGAASTDPDGTITLYEWDLNNDGTFEATGVSQSFTCTAPEGAKPIALRVTDNGGLTNVATGSVQCNAAAPSTVRSRWVSTSGETVTSVASGQAVILEIDIQLEGTHAIDSFQGSVSWAAGRLAFVAGTELNCSNPGGQVCPSGTPATGNVDRMINATAVLVGNSVGIGNASLQGGPGTGIQGLMRLEFTAGSAGPLDVTLLATEILNGLIDFTGDVVVAPVPTLTIN